MNAAAATLPNPLRVNFCGLELNSPIVLLSGCVGFGEEYTRVAGFSNRDVGATGFNYFTVAPDVDNWNSPLFKVDHKIGENNLAFRWQTSYNDVQNPFAGSDTGLFGLFNDDKRSLAGIDYTHMLSPSLLFEVRLGYARNATVQRGRNGGENIAEQLRTFDGKLAKEAYSIVADSGTGELAGIRGDGSSVAGHEKENPMTLDYEL